MSDNPEIEPVVTPPDPSPTPAGAQNTAPVDDQRIPKARFDEVNRERNELKVRLEKLEAAEEQRKLAAMTDLERAQKEKEEASARASQLEAQLEQERQQRLIDRRNNHVATALAAAQAIDADETVTWLSAHRPDELQAALKADGSADPDQIKKLIDIARAERPHHFRPGGPGSPSNRGGELPATNMDAGVRESAAFLREYGFEPDEKRLAAFIHQHRDSQAKQS